MKGHCCEDLKVNLQRQDVGIVYVPKFREYGISYLDGGSSYQLISFCPWCGQKLPISLRSAWFETLENMKLEPNDSRIPSEYLSDEWWRKK
jgi:hypothetical protein